MGGIALRHFLIMVAENKLDQKGQAIFEFIIFLPFLLILLSIMITFATSINGSINQQKVTRGYFFYRAKGNSYIPSPHEVTSTLRLVSMRFVGWAERLEGSGGAGAPYAACYKMSSLIGFSNSETCDSKLNGNTTTSFVKPKTVFGLCTNSYMYNGSEYTHRIEDANCSLAM